MRPHVLKAEASAWICRIAADHAGRQKCAELLHVSQCDVVHVDQWLGLTGHDWIEHAAWVI